MKEDLRSCDAPQCILWCHTHSFSSNVTHQLEGATWAAATSAASRARGCHQGCGSPGRTATTSAATRVSGCHQGCGSPGRTAATSAATRTSGCHPGCAGPGRGAATSPANSGGAAATRAAALPGNYLKRSILSLNRASCLSSSASSACMCCNGGYYTNLISLVLYAAASACHYCRRRPLQFYNNVWVPL